MDYSKNRRYFEPIDNTIGWTLIIIGAVLCLIGIVFMPLGFHGSIAIGLVLFLVGGGIVAGGIVFMQMNKKKIVTDAEYDDSVSSMLSNMQSKALNKLGLDEDEIKEIEPISIDGYAYKGAMKVKKGTDGLWRTNKYEMVMLFFSEHEVHCYKYNFDTIQQKQTESTDVYFYTDIVSVSTDSASVQVANQNIEYEYFKLTTAGGTALEVSLRDVDNAQRSINAMRALLRNKKQQR